MSSASISKSGNGNKSASCDDPMSENRSMGTRMSASCDDPMSGNRSTSTRMSDDDALCEDPWFVHVPLPFRRSEQEIQTRITSAVQSDVVRFMVTHIRLQDGVATWATQPSLHWAQDTALLYDLEVNARKQPWQRIEAQGREVTAVMLGMDASGCTVSAFVTGWMPYFDIVVPPTWSDAQFERLREAMPWHARPRCFEECAMPGFYGYVPDDDKPTQPKQERCWQLKFATLAARTSALDWFQKCPDCFARRAKCPAEHGGHGAVACAPYAATELKVLNAMQTPEACFLFDTKLIMSGWAAIKPLTIVGGLKRQTRRSTTDMEVDARVSNVAPLKDAAGQNVEDVAPLVMECYDLENQSWKKGFLDGARAFPSLSSGDCTTYCGVSFACMGKADEVTSVLIVRAPCTRADNTAAALQTRGGYAFEQWDAAASALRGAGVAQDVCAKALATLTSTATAASASSASASSPSSSSSSLVPSAETKAKAAPAAPRNRVFVHWVDTSKDLVEAFRDLSLWAQPSVLQSWNGYCHDDSFLYEEYMQNFLPMSLRGGESAQAVVRTKLLEMLSLPAEDFESTTDLFLRARKKPGAFFAWKRISERRDIGLLAAFSVSKAAKLMERRARLVTKDKPAAGASMNGSPGTVMSLSSLFAKHKSLRPTISMSAPSQPVSAIAEDPTGPTSGLERALGRMSIFALLRQTAHVDQEAAAASASASSSDHDSESVGSKRGRSSSDSDSDSDAASDAGTAPAALQPKPVCTDARSDATSCEGLRVDDVLEYRARMIRESLHAFLDKDKDKDKDPQPASASLTTDVLLARLSEAQRREFWEWTATTFSKGMVDLLRAPVQSSACPRRGLYRSCILGDCCTLYEKKMESQAKGSQFYAYVDAFGCITMDVMLKVKDDRKPPSSALKWNADWWLNHDSKGHRVQAEDDPTADTCKIDLPYERQFQLYEDGTFEGLAEIGIYCARDTTLPMKIVSKLKMMEGLLCLSRVSSTPPQTCQNGGQQIKVFNALARFVHRQYGLSKGDCGWPKASSVAVSSASSSAAQAFSEGKRAAGGKRKKAQYVGATVLAPIAGYYDTDEPIATLDFASLYPSIMMSRNLCPSSQLLDEGDIEKILKDPQAMVEIFEITHVREDGSTFVKRYYINMSVESVTTRLLRYLVAERGRVKALMKAARGTPMYDIYDQLQLAIKLLCNSTYGFYGCDAETGMLSCMALAAITTSEGRDMIAATKAYVETTVPGAVVVYGDTDSVMVKYPRGTSIQSAHHQSVKLASDITEGMRFNLPGFEHLKGAAKWRKVVEGWIAATAEPAAAAAQEAERAAVEAELHALQLHDPAAFVQLSLQKDERIQKAYTAAYQSKDAERRKTLRDFAAAAKVLEIAPEKVYCPMLVTRTKKAYTGKKYVDGKFDRIEIKGQAAVRRDIPTFVSECGTNVSDALMDVNEDSVKGEALAKAKAIIQKTLEDVLHERLPIDAYVKSASIGTEYADEPMQIKVVNKMRARGDDDVPSAGQRVDMIVLELPPEKAARMTKTERERVADRADHPAYVKAFNAKEPDSKKHLKVDRVYYLEKLRPSIEKIFADVDGAWCDSVFTTALQRCTDPLGRAPSKLGALLQRSKEVHGVVHGPLSLTQARAPAKVASAGSSLFSRMA